MGRSACRGPRYPRRVTMTCERQSAEREDPLAPQRILEQLTADERGSFLQQ